MYKWMHAHKCHICHSSDRRSARNFVAASNNGVTHLEDLRSESISSFSIQSATESIYDDVSSIGGLEEVYKKIIKVIYVRNSNLIYILHVYFHVTSAVKMECPPPCTVTYIMHLTVWLLLYWHGHRRKRIYV